ncbi:hypothetical protein [Streptomyces sp. cg36]|uniref:hypothetical protein n=1 Tax=Streptomyces sp. cg36 TaxID=3238798 RepID=UPI0034E25C95
MIQMRPAPHITPPERADYRAHDEDPPDGTMTRAGWEAVQSGTDRGVWRVYENGRRRGALEAPNTRSEGWWADVRPREGRDIELGTAFTDKHAAAAAVRAWHLHHNAPEDPS